MVVLDEKMQAVGAQVHDGDGVSTLGILYVSAFICGFFLAWILDEPDAD
jgi:hypothetical protein